MLLLLLACGSSEPEPTKELDIRHGEQCATAGDGVPATFEAAIAAMNAAGHPVTDARTALCTGCECPLVQGRVAVPLSHLADAEALARTWADTPSGPRIAPEEPDTDGPSITVVGDVPIVMLDAQGTTHEVGDLAPGTYTVLAKWKEGSRGETAIKDFEFGGTDVRITCSRTVHRCKAE